MLRLEKCFGLISSILSLFNTSTAMAKMSRLNVPTSQPLGTFGWKECATKKRDDDMAVIFLHFYSTRKSFIEVVVIV
jgi:hypothetical protein